MPQSGTEPAADAESADGRQAVTDLEGRCLRAAWAWLANRGVTARIVWTGPGAPTHAAAQGAPADETALAGARIIAVRPAADGSGWDLVAARFPGPVPDGRRGDGRCL